MASPCPRKVQILSGRRVPAQGETAGKHAHPPPVAAARQQLLASAPRHTPRFHSAVGFDTRPLASTLHSMVRVSRRVVAVGVAGEGLPPRPSSVVEVRGAAQRKEAPPAPHCTQSGTARRPLPRAPAHPQPPAPQSQPGSIAHPPPRGAVAHASPPRTAGPLPRPRPGVQRRSRFKTPRLNPAAPKMPPPETPSPQRFHALFTLSPESLSSFLHSTCLLSVAQRYLALTGLYPPPFKLHSQTARLASARHTSLRSPAAARGHHPVARCFPARFGTGLHSVESSARLQTTTAALARALSGLGSSVFTRRY